ncbi:MAG: hypothetical protein IT569_02330 [Leptospiraceae bacterium]|nr:hypothetical protein [Leptospiraceae bacterium]
MTDSNSINRRNLNHPRYRIEEAESNPHGDVYDCDITYYYDVVEVKTGKIIQSYRGTSSSRLGDDGNWGDSTYYGVRDVTFSEDGKFVLVYEEGTTLPKEIRLPE